MLTMTAAIGQTPPDHRGGYDLETGELTATAATYNEALEDIKAKVPDGWRILAVRVDR